MVLNDEVQVGLVRTLRHPDIDAFPLYDDELALVCNPAAPLRAPRRGRAGRGRPRAAGHVRPHVELLRADAVAVPARRRGGQHGHGAGQHRGRQEDGRRGAGRRAAAAGVGRARSQQRAAGRDRRRSTRRPSRAASTPSAARTPARPAASCTRSCRSWRSRCAPANVAPSSLSSRRVLYVAIAGVVGAALLIVGLQQPLLAHVRTVLFLSQELPQSPIRPLHLFTRAPEHQQLHLESEHGGIVADLFVPMGFRAAEPPRCQVSCWPWASRSPDRTGRFCCRLRRPWRDLDSWSCSRAWRRSIRALRCPRSRRRSSPACAFCSPSPR